MSSTEDLYNIANVLLDGGRMGVDVLDQNNGRKQRDETEFKDLESKVKAMLTSGELREYNTKQFNKKEELKITTIVKSWLKSGSLSTEMLECIIDKISETDMENIVKAWLTSGHLTSGMLNQNFEK